MSSGFEGIEKEKYANNESLKDAVKGYFKNPRFTSTNASWLIKHILSDNKKISTPNIKLSDSALRRVLGFFDKDKNEVSYLKQEHYYKIEELIITYINEIKKEFVPIEDEDFVSGDVYAITKYDTFNKLDKSVCKNKDLTVKYDWKKESIPLAPIKFGQQLQRCIIQVATDTTNFHYPVRYKYKYP